MHARRGHAGELSCGRARHSPAMRWPILQAMRAQSAFSAAHYAEDRYPCRGSVESEPLIAGLFVNPRWPNPCRQCRAGLLLGPDRTRLGPRRGGEFAGSHQGRKRRGKPPQYAGRLRPAVRVGLLCSVRATPENPPGARLFHCQTWWRGLDSNQRRRAPADLQSAPFSHSGTPPGRARGLDQSPAAVNECLPRSCSGVALLCRSSPSRYTEG